MQSTYLHMAAIGGLLAICATGCESSIKLTPVSGEVFVDQRPAEGATVIFRPVEGVEDARWAVGFPRATVDADGKFQLTTQTAADGAPAGQYIVLVLWPGAEPALRTDGEATAAPPDQLRGRYASPETSPLRAEVANHATVVPRFNLTGTAP